MARSFPTTRMRRNRYSEFARRLVRETELSAADLIYPIFIIEGTDQREPVASMPGIDRLSIDQLLLDASNGYRLWVICHLLFEQTNKRQLGKAMVFLPSKIFSHLLAFLI